MAIKIFDLRCANGHTFEGWFSSAEDFQEQNRRGLISCPICSSSEIVRVPNTSRIGQSMKSAEVERRREQRASEAGAPSGFEAVMARVREAAAKAEDVGENFAREAREIHAGRAPERNIRGLCTAREAVELVEEGITVLPIPESAGKTLN